jgi:hypothetical protein
MHFKMIVVFVEDKRTDAVMDAAREAGATGATIIHNARGEGLKVSKTFFGAFQVDVEDAVGIVQQVEKIKQDVEELL